jgi:hypothetical protein
VKNSGNEAKKYLKTKDITFLNAANSALFARKATHFGPQKEQKTPHFAKTKLNISGGGQGLETTHCWLDTSRGTGILPVQFHAKMAVPSQSETLPQKPTA